MIVFKDIFLNCTQFGGTIGVHAVKIYSTLVSQNATPNSFVSQREKKPKWIRKYSHKNQLNPYCQTAPIKITTINLTKPTQDICLLRIFQFSHIVLHSYQSVQCVCVCVCVFCTVMRDTLSILFFYNIFHLDVHYVCMLVQCFEPHGRCFTNVHYY